MIVELDDDDTIPTGNAELRSEIAAAVAPLAVVEWSVATSSGRRRTVNEDAWGQRDGVFVVADGMGGRGGGALAARTAIAELIDRVPIRHGSDWRSVIGGVNAAVIRAGRDQGVERLGTTLLAAVIGGPVVTILHVGDSRAYRLSPSSAGGEGDGIDVLTSDHNVRSELLAAGLDVGHYRDRGVALHGLTSYLGIDDDMLRVDVLAVPVRSGDRLLLCSDGIHRQLPDARILASTSRASTARGAAQQLVDDADEAGGRDNATALVLQLGRIAGRP